MSQSYHFNNNAPVSFASNAKVNSGATETVILDKIPCLGFHNLSVSIVNYTGAISACALYGSPDGVRWIAVTGFSTFAVSAGQTGHAEATGNFQYLRLTTTGVALIDAYIIAAT